MKFISTKNDKTLVSFSQAVRECIPHDGGVFYPDASSFEDLRKWLYYIDEKTSFSSIAGILTSAFMNEEFSPIICEKIAHEAFPFQPLVKQLEDNLFNLQLYHGFTGLHRDFGVSYLSSYLETTLELNGGDVIFLDYTNGSLGSLLAKVLKDKKHLKALVIYKKGNVRGLQEEDLFWNGGNIYPVEIDASEEEIRAMISAIFKDRDFVKDYNLTVANSANICRFMAQIFFFPFAFSRIKALTDGDIYYALDADNFGTLMAGLYSWRFALPVNGFYIPINTNKPFSSNSSSSNIDSQDFLANLEMGLIDLSPAGKINLERLSCFFARDTSMIRSFIYPNQISDRQREKAAKELFHNYGLFADIQTANAYAAIKENAQDIFDTGSSAVLVSYNHPSLSGDYCRYITGQTPTIPENILSTLKKVDLNRKIITSLDELKAIIKSIKK